MTIENTSLRDRGWVLGVNPGAIAAQEKRGQAELISDTALPVEGLDDPAFATMGIEVIGPRANDPLFADVRLPTGWKLQATSHDMWSHLLDADGKKRAAIFYKAAYYDRHAFIEVASE